MKALCVRLHRELADYHNQAIVRFTSEDALWQSLIAGLIMFEQADEDEVQKSLAGYIEERGHDVQDDLGPHPMQTKEDCDEYEVLVDVEVEDFIEEYLGTQEAFSYFLLKGFFLLFAVDDLLEHDPDVMLSVGGRKIPLQQIFLPEYMGARLSS